jgi:hypothetical protein
MGIGAEMWECNTISHESTVMKFRAHSRTAENYIGNYNGRSKDGDVTGDSLAAWQPLLKIADVGTEACTYYCTFFNPL